MRKTTTLITGLSAIVMAGWIVGCGDDSGGPDDGGGGTAQAAGKGGKTNTAGNAAAGTPTSNGGAGAGGGGQEPSEGGAAGETPSVVGGEGGSSTGGSVSNTGGTKNTAGTSGSGGTAAGNSGGTAGEADSAGAGGVIDPGTGSGGEGGFYEDPIEGEGGFGGEGGASEPPPPPPPPNLITNGTFETDASGWYGWVGTQTVSTAFAHGGLQSLEVTAGGNAVATITSAVVPGSTYKVSVWATLAAEATAESLHITLKTDCPDPDGDGEEVDPDAAYSWVDGTNVSVGPETWTELTGTFSVPDCAVTEVSLYTEPTTSGSTVTYYIDDVVVTEVIP